MTEGRCDIGLASRDLKEEETADLQGTMVAIDGIGMIVHPDNPVTDLTIGQIRDIGHEKGIFTVRDETRAMA